MTGKLHPTDACAMSVEDEDKSFVVAVDNLVKVLYRVASSDSCRGFWQYSVHTFVNRGSATSPNVLPMSTHLLNEDCTSFIKRFN